MTNDPDDLQIVGDWKLTRVLLDGEPYADPDVGRRLEIRPRRMTFRTRPPREDYWVIDAAAREFCIMGSEGAVLSRAAYELSAESLRLTWLKRGFGPMGGRPLVYEYVRVKTRPATAAAAAAAAAARATELSREPEPSAARLPAGWEATLAAVVVTGSNAHGPATEGQVDALERALGVRLPGDYRAFLQRHNGGVVTPAGFRFGGDEMNRSVLRELLPVIDEAPAGVASVNRVWAELRAERPRLTVVPFATDVSGNVLALRLRGVRAGEALFLDHETGEDRWAARSFTEFLAGLREPAE